MQGGPNYKEKGNLRIFSPSFKIQTIMHSGQNTFLSILSFTNHCQEIFYVVPWLCNRLPVFIKEWTSLSISRMFCFYAQIRDTYIPVAYSFSLSFCLTAEGVLATSRSSGSNSQVVSREYIKRPSLVLAAQLRPVKNSHVLMVQSLLPLPSQSTIWHLSVVNVPYICADIRILFPYYENQ